MSNRFTFTAILFLAACGSTTTDKAPALPTGASSSGVSSLPVEATTLAAVGLDPDAINEDVNACDNFYEFACGDWLAKTEIPADKARYGRFTQIYERNEATLHAVLTEAQQGTLQSPVAEKIGAYFGACMDEAAIEKAGTAALKPLLGIVKGVRNTKTLDKAVAQLHNRGISVLFGIASTPDFADATKMVADMSQGGLGLPDRDYYLKDDERSLGLRKAYQEHIAAMLMLNGMAKNAAGKAATDILKIETELAKVTMARADRRNPENIYHKIDRAGLEKLVPTVDWSAYFTALGFSDIQEITVDSEEFFGSLNSLRESVKPAAWKNYLTWHILDATASALPKKFVDQNFKMSQLLTGAQELPPRWKRCVGSTNSALGELVAQPYLERMFGPEAKAGADSMVSAITTAFATTVNGLEWMSAETKAKALNKLDSMSPMFGYPATWKSYEWTVDAGDHAANVFASRSFEKARDLAKIGKPYDRSEWFMPPQTTNAYYNPLANQMVFPAGILQRPFFSKDAHVPVNLGAMGMIVGHELTHGFDDSGAKFDGDGNMKNWWAAADLEKFTELGECVVKQYEAYEPLEGLHLNGKLTLGENIADMGGIKLAFMAYHDMLADADKTLVADGYTEDQQFFLAAGQAWCSKAREEITRNLAVTDPHSPAAFRVIGALSNLPEFAETWGCEEGSPMAPKNSCSIW